MRTPRWWGGWLAGVALAALVAGACGLDKRAVRGEEDEPPRIGADQLDELDEHSVLHLLEPEEREAVRRSGMTGIEADDEPTGPFAPEARRQQGSAGRAADTAGKVGISVLGVALSMAAVAAPFFLF